MFRNQGRRNNFQVKGNLSLFKTRSKFSSMNLAKRSFYFFTDEASLTNGNVFELIAMLSNFKGNVVSLAYIVCVREGKDWNLHEFLEL